MNVRLGFNPFSWRPNATTERNSRKERYNLMSVPSKEQLKARSKHLSKLLQEKYNIKVSHGHCLDVVAQLFGIKDWNTASATLASEASTAPMDDGRHTLAEYFSNGYSLAVEQPFKAEKYYAGGSTASHSVEEGVRPVGPFTLRADHENRLVMVTLPMEKSVSTTDPVIDMHKQLYLQKDKVFAEKLGGRAEDLTKMKKNID